MYGAMAALRLSSLLTAASAMAGNELFAALIKGCETINMAR